MHDGLPAMELRQTMQRSLPAPTSPYQRQSSAAGCSNLPAGSELLLSHTLSTSGVRVRRKHLPNLPTICEKLRAIFNVQLQEIQSKEEPQYQQQFATFQVLQETIAGPGAAVGSTVGSIVIGNGDLLCQIQQFIDSLCTNEAEDSSYDSDCEGEDISHEQVSRTTSDTLGQEFAEYVSSGGGGTGGGSSHHPHGTVDVSPTTTALPEHSPGYQQRVEFALKLGYTERLVQAALQRLGPNPAQNELLAELIKLGSQPGAKCANEFTVDHHHHHHHGLGESGGGLGTDGGSASTAPGTGAGMASEESLRPIVIDGSNVAMSHGNKEVFSCRGIRLCVDWFKNRGHKDITVFVPKWRKESSRPDNPVKDGEILNELEKERMLVFTPSRLVGGKRMVCYDDRYILKLAADNDGVVVSNDNYRDLVQESSEFKKVVEERVLMYSFVNDRFMPPDDPLGRSGPTLDNFLRVQPRKGDPPPPCPYGKKCTYGNKCKFYHPERGSLPHKSVTERLSEYAARHLQARSGLEGGAGGSGRCAVQGKSLSVPLSNSSSETSPINDKRKALCRTRSNIPSESSNSSSLAYGGGINLGTPPMPSDPMMLPPHQGQHPAVRPPQQLPFLAPPGAVASNRPLPWDQQHHLHQPHGGMDVQQIFPKSHSIENISKEPYVHHAAAGLHHAGCYGTQAAMWPRGHQPSSAQQQASQGGAGGGGAGGLVSQTAPSSLDQSDPNGLAAHDGVNLHRKLHRQLTLNPAGCDPRIYQMQRMQQQSSQQQPGSPQQQQQQQQQQQSSHATGAPQLSPHRPLAPSLSGGSRPSPPTQWELHQHVQRIASAPDSVRPWGHNGPPPASSSEPHINLGWSSNPAGAPANNHSQQQQQQQQQHHQQQQHDRRRLHYHLASIFPEEQVQTVMQMYPDETDAQTICAAILTMFKKM